MNNNEIARSEIPLCGLVEPVQYVLIRPAPSVSMVISRSSKPRRAVSSILYIRVLNPLLPTASHYKGVVLGE